MAIKICKANVTTKAYLKQVLNKSEVKVEVVHGKMNQKVNYKEPTEIGRQRKERDGEVNLKKTLYF